MDIEKRLRNERLSNLLDCKLKELSCDLEDLLSQLLDINYEITYDDYGLLNYFIKSIRKVKKDILYNEEKEKNGK